MSECARALGLDISERKIRLVRLDRSNDRAAIAGYAAVDRTAGPLDDQVRDVARALSTNGDMPIAAVPAVIADGAERSELFEALDLDELGPVTIISRADASKLAIGSASLDNVADTGFPLCPVPHGLLRANPGLSAKDLAPAIGAALSILKPASGPTSDRAAVEVWTPDSAQAGEASAGVDAWASTVTDEPTTTRRRWRLTGWLIAIAALVGLTLLVGGILLAFLASGGEITTGADGSDNTVSGGADRGDGTDRAASDDDQADVDEAAVGDGETIAEDVSGDESIEPAKPADPPGGSATENVGDAPSTERPDTEPPDTEPPDTEPPDSELVPLDELPKRGAIFRPPILYLEGPVTAAEGEALYQRAIEVVGSDNVVNNYIIRPDAPAVTEGNVRVEQAVLFETGSAVIAPTFTQTLELGVLVMTLNPQVTMVVEGHTDDVGSDAVNLALSERRADSVVEYMIGRGLERHRFTSVGLGESEPVADNATEAGRGVNRRIEVELIDLLSLRPAE